jgi:hypothetical protein
VFWEDLFQQRHALACVVLGGAGHLDGAFHVRRAPIQFWTHPSACQKVRHIARREKAGTWQSVRPTIKGRAMLRVGAEAFLPDSSATESTRSQGAASRAPPGLGTPSAYILS